MFNFSYHLLNFVNLCFIMDHPAVWSFNMILHTLWLICFILFHYIYLLSWCFLLFSYAIPWVLLIWTLIPPLPLSLKVYLPFGFCYDYTFPPSCTYTVCDCIISLLKIYNYLICTYVLQACYFAYFTICLLNYCVLAPRDNSPSRAFWFLHMMYVSVCLLTVLLNILSNLFFVPSCMKVGPGSVLRGPLENATTDAV